MKAIVPNLDMDSHKPLYLQLYEYLKSAIINGEIVCGEKLPSLRNLAENLSVSITTVDEAYGQLVVEGYIHSKQGSGYYVADIPKEYRVRNIKENIEGDNLASKLFHRQFKIDKPDMYYDETSFNWNRWKKCLNRVLNEYSPNLLFESNPQGEEVLRKEIGRYIFEARGVIASPSQIVLGAGTQQITSQLSVLLKNYGIDNISFEKPGYMPVAKILKDRGFNLNYINVKEGGIDINCLPTNIATATYVNPSNQFPTGAVMPIANRYRILKWAEDNGSYIIEDDYDSELRYFGRPIPPLKALDEADRVIYLGSFSSTLFPSVKISYMVLPKSLEDDFLKSVDEYSQTCSKMEQLALALFMKEGWYQKGIKKLRRQIAVKLENVIKVFEEKGKDFVQVDNTGSGLNIGLKVNSNLSSVSLCKIAESQGIMAIPGEDLTDGRDGNLIFLYFSRIPLDTMEIAIEKLLLAWKTSR